MIKFALFFILFFDDKIILMSNKDPNEFQNIDINNLQYNPQYQIPDTPKPIHQQDPHSSDDNPQDDAQHNPQESDQQIRLQGAELAEMVQKNKQLVKNCMDIVRKEKPRAVSCIFVSKEKIQGKPKYSLKVTSNFFYMDIVKINETRKFAYDINQHLFLLNNRPLNREEAIEYDEHFAQILADAQNGKADLYGLEK